MILMEFLFIPSHHPHPTPAKSMVPEIIEWFQSSPPLPIRIYCPIYFLPWATARTAFPFECFCSISNFYNLQLVVLCLFRTHRGQEGQEGGNDILYDFAL